MDPYSILGVSEDADEKTIKKAYRTLAAEHHPDRGGDAEKFKTVAEAYSILSDDQKRAEYHASQHHGFRIDDLFRGFGGFNPFEEFFGNRQAQRQRVKKDTEDSDIQFDVRVSLDQIKQGVSHVLTFERNQSCQECSGKGGDGRKACAPCGGSGSRVARHSAFFVQHVTCEACGGRGIFFEQPCCACNTHGYVKVRDQVTIKLGEDK
ncbi:MAG TPA: hypothetical protein EYG51_24055 [Pseudomonadales bacterium]|nr:hypothetical protein [Pseudomonadales bacterium]